MAEVVSAKWVFFFAVSINIVCTLLTPLACYTSEFLVYVMRVGEGLGGGVTFPTTHVLLAHWAPPHERSTMSSIAFSGTILGTVVSIFFFLLLNLQKLFHFQNKIFADKQPSNRGHSHRIGLGVGLLHNGRFEYDLVGTVDNLCHRQTARVKIHNPERARHDRDIAERV